MKKKIWVLEASRRGVKHYLHPGHFWSIYPEGAREFGTKASANEEKKFCMYNAKAIEIEVLDTSK